MEGPVHYGVVLYPGFQLLDVAGPLDILNLLSQNHDLKLSILSNTLEPVTTLQPGAKTTFAQSIVPTHTFADAPKDIEVLLVPGGLGARDEANIQSAIDYVSAAYPKLQYLITVCTGSALVAKAGILDGVRATSNKAAFEWASLTSCPKFTYMSRLTVYTTVGPLTPSSGQVGEESTMGGRSQHMDKFRYQCRYRCDLCICGKAIWGGCGSENR